MSARARGLLLLVPAFALWAVTQVWPVMRLLVASLTSRDGALTGEHYGLLFSRRFGPALVTGLSLGLAPLLVFIALGLGLGWAGHRVSRRSRLVGRCLVAAPMACFVPVAAALPWLDSVDRMAGLVLLGWLGVLCGVAATAYLAAFRARRRRLAVMVVTGLAALAALALGLGQFTIPYLAATQGRLPAPLDLIPLRYAVPTFDANLGAAAMIAVMAIPAALGVAAVVLLVVARARLERSPVRPEAGTEHRARLGRPLFAGLVAVVLIATAVVLWPWLSGLVGGVKPADLDGLRVEPPAYDGWRVFLNTWVIPLPSVLAATLAAAAGGYAIGALRPLGARSELLLLPFAPWLFVGVAPAALARVLPYLPEGRPSPSDRVGPTLVLLSLTPPAWFSVPALVAFTLLFRGRSHLRPLLPAAALIGAVVWVVQAHDYIWSAVRELVPRPPVDRVTGTTLDVYLRTLRWVEAPDAARVVTPVPLVLLALAVVIAAQFHLDRLTFAVGEPTAPSPEPAIHSGQKVLERRPPGYRLILIAAALGVAFGTAGIAVGCAPAATPAPVVPGVSPPPIPGGPR